CWRVAPLVASASETLFARNLELARDLCGRASMTGSTAIRTLGRGFRTAATLGTEGAFYLCRWCPRHRRLFTPQLAMARIVRSIYLTLTVFSCGIVFRTEMLM